MCKVIFHITLFCGFFSAHAQQTVGLFNRDPGAIDGYILFAPNFSNNTYLIDKCGYQMHSWTSSYQPGQSVYLLEDGTLLRTGRVNNTVFNSGGSGGIIERFDWNSNLIWSYLISSATDCQHHDIHPLPNGNILAIAWELKTVPEAVSAGRNPSLLGSSLWSEKIIELEPTGSNTANIVWEWHVWDHLIQDYDSLKLNYGIVSMHPELINVNFTSGGATASDWLHVNSVDYNAELDQVLISSHNLSEILVIDHSTTTNEAASHSGGIHGKGGDLLYRWGNPASYNRGSSADKKLFGQHNAQWIRPGLNDAGNILIFNNGLQRPGGNFSTVDILAPPIDSSGGYLIVNNQHFQPDSAFWSYSAAVPTSFYSMNISGAQRLENGNTLICEGMPGNFFEIDSLKNTVWNYVNPVGQAGNIITQGNPATQNSVFRCTQIEPSYAGLTGQVLTPGNPIELNPLPYVCNMLSEISHPEKTGCYFHLTANYSGQLNLFADKNVGGVSITFSDLTGRIICQSNLMNLSSEERILLPMPQICAKGIYLLQLITVDGKFTFRILR